MNSLYAKHTSNRNKTQQWANWSCGKQLFSSSINLDWWLNLLKREEMPVLSNGLKTKENPVNFCKWKRKAANPDSWEAKTTWTMSELVFLFSVKRVFDTWNQAGHAYFPSFTGSMSMTRVEAADVGRPAKTLFHPSLFTQHSNIVQSVVSLTEGPL